MIITTTTENNRCLAHPGEDAPRAMAARAGGMTAPKVSIIVPVYNVEKYLRRCVDSILAQTFTEFECVLVDDCSPDGSPGICNEYAAKDARVRVIHNGRNLGSSLARKAGIEASSAPYIQFVDSDDWIESEMTERLYARAQKEKADIVLCDVLRDDQYVEPIPLFHDIRGMNKDDIIKLLMIKESLGGLWCKLCARKLFDRLEFPTHQYNEDAVVSVQLFLNACNIAYETSFMYHYCRNSASLCSSPKRRNKNREDMEANLQTVKRIFQERGVYELYGVALEQRLHRNRKMMTQGPFTRFIRRAVKALMPYGVLRLLGYRLRKRGTV
jgi:glycosyltransferase involved in cell wall biosynthesis